jgi:hypothetical protein
MPRRCESSQRMTLSATAWRAVAGICIECADTQIDAGPRVAATRPLAGTRLPMRPPSRVVMPSGKGELSADAWLAIERYRKAPPTEETDSAN